MKGRHIITAVAVVGLLLVLSTLGHPLLWEVPLPLAVTALAVRAAMSPHVGAVALGLLIGAVAGALAYMFTFGPGEAFDSDLLDEGGMALLLFGVALFAVGGAGIGYLVSYHRRRGGQAHTTCTEVRRY